MEDLSPANQIARQTPRQSNRNTLLRRVLSGAHMEHEAVEGIVWGAHEAVEGLVLGARSVARGRHVGCTRLWKAWCRVPRRPPHTPI